MDLLVVCRVGKLLKPAEVKDMGREGPGWLGKAGLSR